MKQESKFKLNQVVLAALFAALTTVLTYFVKIPSVNGYMHIGDSMIYLCASILPTPIAAIAAGIGAALSDAIGGYTMYIIPTFIIKALLVLCFTHTAKTLLCKRNVIGVFVAAFITIAGYYVAEVIILALSAPVGFTEYLFSVPSWVSALNTLPGNAIQAGSSGVLYLVLSAALDKIKIKDIIRKN